VDSQKIMGKETLNLTDKKSWTLKNAKSIALLFGYACNKPFKEALTKYKKIVEGATVTDYLSVIAYNHFRNTVPPLKKR